MEWTIVILRTSRGEEIFDRLVADGRVETRSMDEFENSTKIMLRLAQRQHDRVPGPPARDPSWVRPPFAMPGRSTPGATED